MNAAAIIPVYNPEEGLVPLCTALVRAFPLVIVVDDGSVLDVSRFDRLPHEVVLLRHAANRGKGRAMKTALAYLSRERPDIAAAVFADGDGQHRIADILAVARRSEERDAVMFGVRNFAGRDVPFRSWWGNRWTAIEVRLLFGYRVGDTQTGLRAVPARLFAALSHLPGERFEYEARQFRLFRALREKIETIPIETIYVHGNRSSHYRPWTDTLLTQAALFAPLTCWRCRNSPSRN